MPTKVKNFIWRAYSNCLPTKVTLKSKNVEVSNICPMCNYGVIWLDAFMQEMFGANPY